MGRTKTSRYRNWRKQMRKRGQRPPRKSYTWDYMSPGRLVAYADSDIPSARASEEGINNLLRVLKRRDIRGNLD